LLKELRKESSFNTVVYENYSTEPNLSIKSYGLADNFKLQLNTPVDSNQIHFNNTITYGNILLKSKAEEHAIGMVQIIIVDNWNEIDKDMLFRLLENTPFGKQ
jgi:hypothetical protein